MTATATEWTELGLVARECGDTLRVRVLKDRGALGWDNIRRALQVAYPDPKVKPRTFCEEYTIDSDHRLAFTRALSPIECEVVCNK
jgi:hypothetical protein